MSITIQPKQKWIIAKVAVKRSAFKTDTYLFAARSIDEIVSAINAKFYKEKQC